MTFQPNTLVMADGTTFEDSSCGFGDRYLWCWLKRRAMAECFAIFTDPEKTSEIAMVYNTKTVVYKGFTELLLIKRGVDVFGDETVDVRLTWPEGGEHSIEEFTPEPEEPEQPTENED